MLKTPIRKNNKEGRKFHDRDLAPILRNEMKEREKDK